MAQLDFPLAQGWTRGLELSFSDAESSASLDLTRMVYLKQTHSSRVIEVGIGDAAKSMPFTEGDGLVCDASVLMQSQKGLMIQTADCCPLIYVHREESKVAIVHAGWRGLVAGIHRKPLLDYGFEPSKTWIWLGPCLNGRSFEVGQDCFGLFDRKVQGDTGVFQPHETQSEKRYFHVWKFLENEFDSMGVEMFYNVEIDTFSDATFASYRRAKKTGLNADARNYSFVRFINKKT